MGKKGFGQSEPPTRQAKKFLLAFMRCMAETQEDRDRVHNFFKSHQAQLNESLLEALPLVVQKLTPEREEIAPFLLTFGNSIQQFPLGDRMLNLELSIAAYQECLKIYTRENFPQDWAGVQNNLGIAYHARIKGERAENLERSIGFHQQALQVYTREHFPEKWARAQNNLGNAYGDRIEGERSENLERSIVAYQQAMQVYTREHFLKKWAMAQNNLGNTYRERIKGDRGENLEQSIVAYQQALQVYTREHFPEKWAGSQNNLGIAYRERIKGERAENLERAIAAYQQALQVRTREHFPQDWAMTQNNLGTAYGERIKGERGENLEQAIAFYQQAAKVFSRDAFPQQWAKNQSDLAETLMKRASLTNKIDDLDSAITLLKASLEVAASGTPYFIDSQYRLGNAFSRYYEYTQNPADLQQALQAYKIALEAIDPEHYDRKQIWQALPTTQSILGSRLVRDGRWQEGLQLLLNSINQLSRGDDFYAHANALFQTGKAHEFLSDWDNARLYYRDALRLYEHLKDELGIAQSRAGLGGVLVSQGYLEKGLAELAKAQEIYQHLQKPNKAAELDRLYQLAKRAWEQQLSNEVYV
ncbi:MAG: tetratricopeptide repeat protein [Cyanosarcina radialis HA8281-LM2]|jgi:tetratricopeptide (TPR) repeat protein|nr:tetratricopeptide repeat protein [Cyanosarcina radialis HA8281-LM2]